MWEFCHILHCYCIYFSMKGSARSPFFLLGFRGFTEACNMNTFKLARFTQVLATVKYTNSVSFYELYFYMLMPVYTYPISKFVCF